MDKIDFDRHFGQFNYMNPRDLSIQKCQSLIKKCDPLNKYTKKKYTSLSDALCDLAAFEYRIRKRPYLFIKLITANYRFFELNKKGMSRINYEIKLDHFWDELLIPAVQKNKNLTTEQIYRYFCLQCFDKNPLVIKDIPSKYLTNGHYLKAITTDYRSFKFASRIKMPKDIFTYEICLNALIKSIKNNDCIFIHIPNELKDYTMCELAVNNSSKQTIIVDIPEEHRNYKLCWTILAIKNECNFHSLSYIPKNVLDDELYIHTLTNNPGVIEYFPERLLTEELCLDVVLKDRHLIRWVPAKFMTETLLSVCIKQYPNLIHQIDERFLTYNIYKIAVAYSNEYLKNVPEDIVDDELLLSSLESRINISLKDKYNYRFYDLEFCQKAFEINPEAIIYFDSGQINDKDIENPFYNYLIQSALKTPVALTYIYMKTDIIDPYIYFLSF